MATRKKTEVPEEALEQEEEIREDAEEVNEPASAWDIKVTVRTPRKSKHDFYYVCVNDRRFEIPADGKEHEMPKPIAEVLQQTLDAEAAADDFAEGIPNRQ